MRTYEKPEMKLDLFSREDIVTQSTTAEQVQAMLGADVNGGSGSWDSRWNEALEVISLTF